MKFLEVLQALEGQCVVSEVCGESPAAWRIVVPADLGSLFPIVETLRLCVPYFDDDYLWEWSDIEDVLLVRER